ncbi:hypothetical protein IQ268_11150 [Oculatella sp. LEGE 06141]|uniref:hypothetical protein n=1 Tax=Oculatella sp. LEGE 06141 TaxID=1828648 RepID=UPI00188099E0|nr:hypothetical protein [Oculatella sp. LEGE 06141]MBE9179118.1 hypothetical protein [Oculatella sp. LEGE 06141]
MTTTHLVKFVLVYPPGQLPPDVKAEDIPDDEPIGSFEDYIFQFSEQPPELGTNHHLNGNQWTIAQVQTYQALQSTPGATKAVHIAICTPDGAVPQRPDWSGGQPQVLYIPALTNGTLALNEDGTNRYGIAVETPLNIPLNNIFEDWTLKYFQSFELVSASAPQSFKDVVICWCKQEPALVVV